MPRQIYLILCLSWVVVLAAGCGGAASQFGHAFGDSLGKAVGTELREGIEERLPPVPAHGPEPTNPPNETWWMLALAALAPVVLREIDKRWVRKEITRK